MYNVSDEIISQFNNNNLQTALLTVTCKDGTTLTITESNIIQGSFSIDRASVSGSKIELGAAIASELNFKLRNFDDDFEDVTFEGAEVDTRIGVYDDAGETLTYIPMGIFIIDEQPRSLSTIEISALDRMVLFDVEVEDGDLTFPATVSELVSQCCSVCGVSCATDLTDVINSSYSIPEAPEGDITYRNLIQWCAGIMGTNAFMDYNGELTFAWYENETGLSITKSNRYNSDIYENALTITGLYVTYTETTTDDDDNETSEEITYFAGTEGYCIDLSDNLLIQDSYADVLDAIYLKVSDLHYLPYEATILAAPYFFPMDVITITDRKGTEHQSIITNATYILNNSTTIKAQGETEQTGSYASGSGLTAAEISAITALQTDIGNYGTLLANYIYSTNASISNLEADIADIEEITSQYVTVEYLEANYAAITSLEAVSAEIETIESTYVTAEYLLANYVTTTYLSTYYVTAEEISSTYATADSLTAINGYISTLTSDVADINTLLAGSVSSGTVQTIHLTSDNTVIDDAIITDAMIASLSASKITSGSIYTSLVTIQTAEDDTTLYIDNSLLQIADEDSNIRIQLGLDGEGNYNYYVFDADGNILFDALGIYGEGIHDGVIINDHVASKTSTYTGISGDKLDIDSVITSINEDGSVAIDANSVTIDGETLDYKLTTIEASANSSLSDYVAYYALSTSSAEAPDFYDATPALADTAIADESMVDYTSLSSDWTTEYVAATDGYYTWRVYVLESTDGTLTIGEAALITGDAVARASTETLTTELSVVQGQIEALVTFTAIEDWYDGTTTIYDMYSSITVELESITSTVESLETAVNGDDDTVGLVSQVATLTETAESIDARVESLEVTVGDDESGLVADVAALTITANTIQSSVSSLSTDYSTLSASVTTVTQTAESLTVSIDSLSSLLTLSNSTIKLSSILTLIEQQYTTNRVLFETTLNDYNVLTSQIGDSDGENIDDILDVLYNEYIELEDTYYKVYGSDESLSDLDYQIYYAYSATSVGDVNDFDSLTWSATTLDELIQMYAYADYALVDSSAVSDYYVYYYLEITQDDGTVTQSVYSLFTGEIEYLSYYDVLYDAIVNAVNADDEDALDEALADYESAWANYVTYESLLESYFSILQTDLLSYSSSNSITVSKNSVQAYADDLVGEYADALEALQTQFDSYFIFDNNGLTIGAATSSDEDEYKMVLRNNGLYLECNDEVTAYIASNNNTSYLYIVNANVENSLMIGGFSYVPRFNYTLVDSAVADTDVVGSTNGGMSIVWNG